MDGNFSSGICLIFGYQSLTCLTIDFITKEKVYKGGRISPGIVMRYQALHQFANQLPLCSISPASGLMGYDTESSIISGVQQGILAEVSEIINVYKKENKETIICVTGGDCFFFEKELKSSIFANPNLVMIGLNEILEVTTKPVIFDADNGGRIEHLSYTVKSLERVGGSAIVIEDKIRLKRNSLFKNQKGIKQDSIKNFCKKFVTDTPKKFRRDSHLLLHKGYSTKHLKNIMVKTNRTHPSSNL